MSLIIHDRGFWESQDGSGHIHDQRLCGGILEYLSAKNLQTVCDFGCGMGDYSRTIISSGWQCDAFDGNPNTEMLTGGIGKVLDFSKKFDLQKKYDCVISLEVGEHIPKEFEQVFLDNVCNHTNSKLILSWAIVGQGGDGHVNCQNNDYIINKLKENGFEYDEYNSSILRNLSTLSWFKNTIMVFDKIK